MKNMTIKEIPLNERPRERLLKNGAEILSNAELLAILIRTGTKNESALALSYRIMNQNQGIRFLTDCSVQELSKIKGIGTAKASQLKAAIELGRRLACSSSGNEIFIRSPQEAAIVLMEDMRYLKKEYMKALLLNTKCGLISIEDISVGNLNSSIVHPREVFIPAIKKSSASIILAHNHPSGDPTPSKEDINITKRIAEAGKIIGIELVDHLIIGDGKYISLKEEGFI
ncbi:MAG: RadC family protein [Bacillota bacterium]